MKIDPSQVDQILVNLVTNARDAIPDVGAITVGTSNVAVDEERCRPRIGWRPGSTFCSRSAIPGRGMDEATRSGSSSPSSRPSPRARAPAWASPPSTASSSRTVASSTSTASQVAARRSRSSCRASPGSGATGGESGAAPAHRDRDGAGRRGRAALLQIVRQTLESLGYTVLAASSPGDAVLLCEAHPGEIDVLLTDVVMPAMNGNELRERLDADQARPADALHVRVHGGRHDAPRHRGAGRSASSRSPSRARRWPPRSGRRCRVERLAVEGPADPPEQADPRERLLEQVDERARRGTPPAPGPQARSRRRARCGRRRRGPRTPASAGRPRRSSAVAVMTGSIASLTSENRWASSSAATAARARSRGEGMFEIEGWGLRMGRVTH